MKAYIKAVGDNVGELRNHSVWENGWLPCDGRAIHPVAAPELFRKIGYTYTEKHIEDGDSFQLPWLLGGSLNRALEPPANYAQGYFDGVTGTSEWFFSFISKGVKEYQQGWKDGYADRFRTDDQV